MMAAWVWGTGGTCWPPRCQAAAAAGGRWGSRCGGAAPAGPSAGPSAPPRPPRGRRWTWRPRPPAGTAGCAPRRTRAGGQPPPWHPRGGCPCRGPPGTRSLWAGVDRRPAGRPLHTRDRGRQFSGTSRLVCHTNAHSCQARPGPAAVYAATNTRCWAGWLGEVMVGVWPS